MSQDILSATPYYLVPNCENNEYTCYFGVITWPL